jgi:diguanylate cyclase (GGDEF)-like protein/PAS domain S-box-containing protein
MSKTSTPGVTRAGRRAEEALHTSKEQLRIALASIGDGVVATDAERRVTQLNRVAETLTGWTSDEAKGKPFAEVFVLLNELTREPLQDPVEEAIVTGRTVRMANHALLVARDGTERPVADSAAPMRDRSGRIVGAVLVFRDVTEERRRRREKDRLLRDLGERVKELECLSRLGRLLQEPGLSLEDALDGAARLLPPAFQHPDRVAARICCEAHQSDAGQHPWDANATPLSADILVRGEKVGWVGVCYPLAGAETGERLFLKEEQTLVDAVAERLGRMIELKRAERALRESEERFRGVFESAADGVLITDAEGKSFSACNPAMCRMLGYSPEEILGLGVADIHPAEDLPRVLDEFGRQVRKEIALATEIPVKRKDGSILYADICSFPITLEGKEHLVGFFRDVTQRRQAEQRLRESEAKNRTLLENLPQRMYYKDTNSVYVSCNKHHARDLKIQAEEIAGKTDYDFYPRELAEKYRRDDQWVVASGKTTEVEEKYVQDGREMTVHTVKTPIRDAAGNVLGVLGIFWDITDRKKYEERLAHLATHDPLTGLPNRRLFEEALARAMARARRGTPSALLLLDLDHFKIVNDFLGHAAGDEALVRVVNLVLEQIRAEDVLSRLGGDEFVVLLEGANLDYAQAVAERIRKAVEAFSFTSDSRVSVSLSIGLVGVGGQPDTAAVLSQADAAMYQAKQSGRNHIAVGQTAPAAPAPCREHDAIS